VILLTGGANKPAGWRKGLVAFFNFLPFVGLKPDVLHFQWNTTAIECLPLFNYFRCPVVVSCRGSQINVAPHNPRRVEIREGLRKTFSQAMAVHCVSEWVQEEAARYGLDKSKARVIRPAVDPNFYDVRKQVGAQRPHSFRIVSTGSLLWVKGYEYSLLAIRRLLDMGVPAEFEIIGSGPEHQRVMYTLHDLGLEQHVRLSGQLSPEGVRERLMQADAFLLSSLSEGISNAALEAMACGLPVVTTDCGGMREAVRDGVDGFIVPVRDVDGMAEALRRLAEDRELCSRLGHAARQRVVKEFGLEQQGAQFIGLYTSLIESAGAHVPKVND
jgi:colanic acid/amylovoran biosynthesis glycosyltransferase